ncbi:hypothetical protein ACFVVQ_12120 [Paenibacillus chitinolyticus]|uniref:hypothetical protein n=1 Tax=Paenibacillus chitinolyticus TaxID=79263 RepID=UPI0036D8BC5B
MAYTYRKPVDDDVPWEQRLVNYSQDKNAGKTEYQRAMEVFNAKNSLGDTTGAASARKWADQVNSATGGYASQPDSVLKKDEFTTQRDNFLKQWGEAASQRPAQVEAPKPFVYNQNEDPYYQNALRQARANIGTEQNNTMAKLRGSGQGNSSLSETLAHQIANKQMERVDTQLLPQMIDQAYNRYQDQNKWNFDINKENYNRENEYRSALSNLMSTYNNLGQQELQNEIAQAPLTGKFNGNNTMDTRVKNMDMMFNWADRTGYMGTPVDDWLNYGFQDKGPRTLQGQTQDLNKAVTESGLTGYFNNLPTLERERLAENIRQFGITSDMQKLGQQQDYDYKQGSLALDKSRLGFQMDQGTNHKPTVSASQLKSIAEGSSYMDVDAKGKKIAPKDSAKQKKLLELIDQADASIEDKILIASSLGLDPN